MPMVPTMQVLSFFGLVRSYGATKGPLFQGAGRPDVLTKLQFARLVILAISIYPLTRYLGILGTSLAVLISSVATKPIADFITLKIIKCPAARYLKIILTALCSTLVMIFSLCILRRYLFTGINIQSFFFLITVGIVLYAGLISICDNKFNFGLRTLMKKQNLHLINPGESSSWKARQ